MRRLPINNDYNADDYGEHHDHEVDVGEAAYHRVVLYFAQLIHHVDAAFLGEHVAAERDDSGHRSGKDLTEDDDHDVGQAAFTKSRGYGHDDRHHDKATGYGAKAVPVVHPEPFGKAESRFPRSHLRGGDPVAVRHLRAHAPQEEHVNKGAQGASRHHAQSLGRSKRVVESPLVGASAHTERRTGYRTGEHPHETLFKSGAVAREYAEKAVQVIADHIKEHCRGELHQAVVEHIGWQQHGSEH